LSGLCRTPAAIGLAGCGVPALAAQSGVGMPGEAVPGLAGGLSQTALGLAAVLALIALLAWAARRLRGRLQPRGGAVELLGGLSLGARERLVLVRVEGVRLLIGVAPGSLRTLHVLDPRSMPADADAPAFAQTLVAQRERTGREL